jgi:rubrerythrin
MPDDAASPIFDAPNAQGSTSEAGQSIDEGKGRTFPCEGCGADLKFHIGQQQLKCPFCGFEKQIEFGEDEAVVEQDFHAMLDRLQELRAQKQGNDADEGDGDASEIRCDSCGGTTVFIGPLTSSECPYCASPLQLNDVHDAEHRVPVDGVLPFLVDKKLAQTNLGEWVQSRWFAPNEFRRRGADGKFSGVYMPYWTYDSMTFTRYSGQRGEHYYVTVGTGKNKRRERRTQWYPASGSFQRFFDDVMVLAAKGMNRKFMLALEPWPLGKYVPFNQEMLAGYLARTYEIELDSGFREAKGRIEDKLDGDVRSRIGGDVQRVHSIRTNYSAISFKHLLLPVWLLAYRYNEKIFQVMINAGTGEVQGERPYSWVKITLTVLAGLAVAAGIFFLVKS